jgi:hypothetical protein
MSKIFEALKRAELVRSGKAAPPPTPDAPELADRRRNRRWPIDFSVYVYGHDQGLEPFHEEVHTLLLTNQLTQKEQDCRVVYLGARHSRTVEAGVVFPQTNPEFWQLHETPGSSPAV